MKLFYYKDPTGNFGDDLNPWIWYSLAPELFNDKNPIGNFGDSMNPWAGYSLAAVQQLTQYQVD